MDEKTTKSKLLCRREELLAESSIGSDGRDIVELDQTKIGRLSRMDAMQAQEMAKAMEVRRHQEIARIDAALGRLEDGEYGYCVSCGEEITPKRLELDPSIATCIACAGS